MNYIFHKTFGVFSGYGSVNPGEILSHGLLSLLGFVGSLGISGKRIGAHVNNAPVTIVWSFLAARNP